MGKQVVVIGQNDTVEIKDLPEDPEMEGDFLSNAVGGWFQSVPLDGVLSGTYIWVNENGKFEQDCLLNTHATFLWNQSYPTSLDYMVGNAVITGDADEDGNTVGLTDDQLGAVVKMLEFSKQLLAR
jgi:hypothetical protein